MRNQLAKPDSFTGLERMLNHKIQNLVIRADKAEICNGLLLFYGIKRVRTMN